MDAQMIKSTISSIYKRVSDNRDYLIQLDQQNGDGDLGVSMSNGFKAVCDFLETNNEQDLGKLFMIMSRILNEAAPSSLGTILSLGMMGMAKSLKGKEEASLAEMADALWEGVENIMKKSGSKEGEKTILDALIPAIKILQEHADDSPGSACALAAEAAAQGSEDTKQMKSVHGRAAYYADDSLGVLDGGSVVGKLIFEGIADSVKGDDN